MNDKIKEACSRIKKLNYNIHYFPSTTTRIQCDIESSRLAFEILLKEGYLQKVIVPKYKDDFMEDLAQEKKEDIDLSELQDPDDFMPYDSAYLEFINAYRKVK